VHRHDLTWYKNYNDNTILVLDENHHNVHDNYQKYSSIHGKNYILMYLQITNTRNSLTFS
jgi:hypothetical protein